MHAGWLERATEQLIGFRLSAKKCLQQSETKKGITKTENVWILDVCCVGLFGRLNAMAAILLSLNLWKGWRRFASFDE
jgi:hypothetical protein